MKGTAMKFRNADEALVSLSHMLISMGHEDDSRAGKTKELTFQHFTIQRPLERELVTPGRKANLAAQIAETMWVLSGRNDVEWLSAYLPRAADFSDNGKTWRAGYGPRLRAWGVDPVLPGDTEGTTDQLRGVVGLLQENSTTRRAVMSIFDPASDYAESRDIPCNNWLHFMARGGVLDLHVAIRSNDLIWGWSGINQFEWSTLLEVVAWYAGLTPGRVHYAVSSLHMYDRHWDKASRFRPDNPAAAAATPRFAPDDPDVGGWDELCNQWFRLESKLRQDIYCEGQIADFPEPMLRSWLHVLAWWWTADDRYLAPYRGTRLEQAARVSTGPRKRPQPEPASQMQLLQGDDALAFLGIKLGGQQGSPFIEETIRLHTEKHAAYGNSWKRRGEMLGIMANIARKVDRLGGAETADETSADTAADLLVYLAKYSAWMRNSEDMAWTDDEEFADANNVLRETEKHALLQDFSYDLEAMLRTRFDLLEQQVVAKDPARLGTVTNMLGEAYALARRRWEALHQTKQRALWGADEYVGADHE